MEAPIPPEQLLAHARHVHAIARGLLWDRDRAEDAAQETWLLAVRKNPNDPGRLRAWLGGIARKVAWKIRRREGERESREAKASRRETIPSAAEMLELEETRHRVVEAVARLGEPYRT